MSLYTRARKHIDMNRVKELREEKIKKNKLLRYLDSKRKFVLSWNILNAEESKYVDWRKDLENLNETMTTASMGMVNYSC